MRHKSENTDRKQQEEKEKNTYKAVIINSEDVLLLGDHVAEATASRVLKRNARGLGAQNLVNIIAIVELVVEAIWDLDGLRRITILNDDQMIRLKKRPPHFEEVEVPDSGDHDIKLVLEERRGGRRWRSHCEEGKRPSSNVLERGGGDGAGSSKEWWKEGGNGRGPYCL